MTFLKYIYSSACSTSVTVCRKYSQITPLSIQSISKQILAHVSEVCCYMFRIWPGEITCERIVAKTIAVCCHLWCGMYNGVGRYNLALNYNYVI